MRATKKPWKLVPPTFQTQAKFLDLPDRFAAHCPTAPRNVSKNESKSLQVVDSILTMLSLKSKTVLFGDANVLVLLFFRISCLNCFRSVFVLSKDLF